MVEVLSSIPDLFTSCNIDRLLSPGPFGVIELNFELNEGNKITEKL